MPQTVSTSKLVDAVAERAGINKSQARQVVSTVLELIGEQLAQGNRLQLGGFGTFEVRERAAREATNPRTREKVQVPASRVVGFRAATSLRSRLGVTDESGDGGS